MVKSILGEQIPVSWDHVCFCQSVQVRLIHANWKNLSNDKYRKKNWRKHLRQTRMTWNPSNRPYHAYDFCSSMPHATIRTTIHFQLNCNNWAYRRSIPRPYAEFLTKIMQKLKSIWPILASQVRYELINLMNFTYSIESLQLQQMNWWRCRMKFQRTQSIVHPFLFAWKMNSSMECQAKPYIA